MHNKSGVGCKEGIRGEKGEREKGNITLWNMVGSVCVLGGGRRRWRWGWRSGRYKQRGMKAGHKRDGRGSQPARVSRKEKMTRQLADRRGKGGGHLSLRV